MSSPRWKGLAQSQALSALYNPAEFSSLVTSYPPCAGEKISLRDTGTFVGLKRDLDQARTLVGLAVNHMEGRTRQRDHNPVILNLNVESEGRGHPLLLSTTEHRQC